jgi:hypothetical protein
MNTSNRFRPQLEALDERTPPSSLPLGPSAPMGLTYWKQYFGANWLPLAGQVSGTWITPGAQSDAGTTQFLTGNGTVSPLGSVQATGTLTAPGFIESGRATGQFTFTDAKGSVTIHLVGANPQPGFSPMPTKFYYSIIGGTGSYAKAWGGGIATLAEVPGKVPPQGPSGTMTPDHIVAATFTLTLQPNV